jgi:hypothetical protein
VRCCVQVTINPSVNAVERILHYSDGSLPQEKAYDISETQPPATWPSEGRITLNKVVMSYCSGLPPVLKGMYVVVLGLSFLI